MFKIFKKPIDRQQEEFFCYKAVKSMPMAESCNEWIELFRKQAKIESIYEIKKEDLEEFKIWLEDNTDSEYRRLSGIKSINSFLKFFRCGMMASMDRVQGRKVNAEAVQLTKKLRATMSFREIAKYFKERKIFSSNIKVIHFWAHYPEEKLKRKVLTPR